MIRRTRLLFSGPPALMALLLLGAAGCGLKGPLYLPDAKQEEVAAPSDSASSGASETSKQRGTPPPAPQAQKRDRNKSGSTTSGETPTPVSPPDPDRPATPPPQGS